MHERLARDETENVTAFGTSAAAADAWLAAGRRRSEGPLDASALAVARVRGLPLAYDPVQIGWVPADCVDDLDPAAAFDAERADVAASPEADVLETLRVELVQRVARLLRRMDTHRSDAEETERAIWRLPEELLTAEGETEADLTLERLRALQAEAHRQLETRPVFFAGRAGRRHRALVDGHDLVLRPWRDDEAPRFRALLDDGRVWKHLPETYPDPLTEEMARDLIALSNEQPHHEVRAIEIDDVAVGQIRTLFGRPGTAASEASDAEISYWLGVDHWGQRIASRAISLYTLLCFQKRPLESIYARVEAGNVASLRALQGAGYRDEGDLSARLDGDGSTRILRCFRADYLDVRSRAVGRRKQDAVAGHGDRPVPSF